MLPAIARHAITTYTDPGDLVLDPMCGIGTTLLEAVHLGRRAAGVEYEARWAALARANLAHATTHGATGCGTVATGDGRTAPALLPDVKAGDRRAAADLPALRRVAARTGHPPRRYGREGRQARLPLLHRPEQPRPHQHHPAAGRVHPDPHRLPAAAPPRRARRDHRPPLARARPARRPPRRRPRLRRGGRADPGRAARCAARRRPPTGSLSRGHRSSNSGRSVPPVTGACRWRSSRTRTSSSSETPGACANLSAGVRTGEGTGRSR